MQVEAEQTGAYRHTLPGKVPGFDSSRTNHSRRSVHKVTEVSHTSTVKNSETPIPVLCSLKEEFGIANHSIPNSSLSAARQSEKSGRLLALGDKASAVTAYI